LFPSREFNGSKRRARPPRAGNIVISRESKPFFVNFQGSVFKIESESFNVSATCENCINAFQEGTMKKHRTLHQSWMLHGRRSSLRTMAFADAGSIPPINAKSVPDSGRAD
jgi:hypothetical protein